MEERSESQRYRLIHKIATGGMATVHVGAVRGGLGFRQLVAIKKPHPHLLELPSVRNELVNEARLASMIQHGNVVDVRDVDVDGDQVNLVMDYIEGASLAELLRAAKEADTSLPPRVVLRIILDACAGLHAAHELVDEDGKRVGLVHRDVSPQNILVGLDGIARVTDFGIAKIAQGAGERTDQGLIKGKLAYMSPEYIAGTGCDARLDVFALGTTCWEALSGERCFKGETDLDTANRIMRAPARPLSKVTQSVGQAFDDVLATAMARTPDKRFPTMRAFGAALEAVAASASLVGTHSDVATTVKALAGASLDERRAAVRAALAREPSLASVGPVETPRAHRVEGAGVSAPPSEEPKSDSRSSEAIALSSAIGPPPAPVGEPEDSASALRASLVSRRPPLPLLAFAISAVALLAVGVIVALTNRSGPRGVAATSSSSSALMTAPAPTEPPIAPVSPAPATPPLELDPGPDPEPEAAAPTPLPVVAPAPVAAPRPAPRPPAPRPPATSAVRPGKPVPPNPYGH